MENTLLTRLNTGSGEPPAVSGGHKNWAARMAAQLAKREGLHMASAVHVQFLPRNIIPVRRKECSGLLHLPGSSKTSERNLGSDLGGYFLRNFPHHLSRCISRDNGVRGDVVLCRLQRHGLGESDDAALAGGVALLSGSSGLGGHAGDVDNAAEALIDHGRQYRTGGVKGAVQIGFDLLLPIFVRHLLQRLLFASSEEHTSELQSLRHL